jgi:hypothetical protein
MTFVVNIICYKFINFRIFQQILYFYCIRMKSAFSKFGNLFYVHKHSKNFIESLSYHFYYQFRYQ